MRWIIGTGLGHAQRGECRPHKALKAWAGNWAPVIIITQTESPSSGNHRTGKKGAQTPSACRIQEDLQIPLHRFKDTVRKPETDPKSSQKVNTNS